MLCPAAVSAAAWLPLALLSLGLSLSAEGDQDPGFSHCSHSFYRQTPPQGFSGGGLIPLCHRLPGGHSFATLHKPTCDTAVYFAFHLSHGWREREGEGEEEEEVAEKEEDDTREDAEDEESQRGVPRVLTPALLRRDTDEPQPHPPVDSPLALWDSLVTELVQNSALPQCHSVGGDLYILTGSGGAWREEGGDGKCEAGVLWSAVCCAGPEGESGFSVGLVRETGERERVVSVKDLEEVVGLAELFLGGCMRADGEGEGDTITLFSKALVGMVEKQSADATADITEEASDEVSGLSTDEQIAGEQVAAVDATPEEVLTQEMTSESAEQRNTEPLASSSDDNKTLASDESDTESSSTLLYLISSSISLLTTPLRPVVSTITQFPGQVTYVLQEDLGVLSTLPGDAFSLFHNMVSDLASGVGSVKDLLVGVGEMGFSGLYSCTYPMVEALLCSCQTGITGVGTLAWDGVGIFGGIVDNTWTVSRFFGGRLWEQSEGYLGAVVSEMGGQVQAVGGGLGKLVWMVGNKVGDVVMMAGGLVVGIVKEVFGLI